MQSWRLVESDLFTWKVELTLVPRVFSFSNMATWHWHRHIGWGRGCEQLNLVSRPFFELFMKRQVQKMYRAFSLKCLAAIQIYWNKRKCLHTKKVELARTGLIWKTNMAAVSLFWNTNIKDMVTSCKNSLFIICTSLRKKPIFGDATTHFPAKWRLRDEQRNSIPMTRNYPDLGSASDWSCRVGNLIQPIRSTIQIWVVTRHQYGISLVSQTSFGGETTGSVAKCRLFPLVTFAHFP